MIVIRKELIMVLLESISDTLTMSDSLELEKGITIKNEDANYPDYFIKIVDNKSEVVG